MRTKKVKRILSDSVKILCKKRLGLLYRLYFLLEYLKINIYGFAHGRIKQFESVKFLGYRWYFVSFSEVIIQIHEVFVEDPCYFKTDKSAPVVFDCGANIGVTSIYFKWLYPNAKVVAFEPSPNVAAVLRKNIIVNKIDKIEVVEAALTDVPGTVKLYLREEMTLAATMEKTEAHGSTECEVKAVRLSEYITGPIDLLWIDVQFSEEKIFRDLTNAGKWSQVISLNMEFHHMYGNSNNSFAKTLSYLEQSPLHYFIELNNKKSSTFASYIISAKQIKNET